MFTHGRVRFFDEKGGGVGGGGVALLGALPYVADKVRDGMGPADLEAGGGKGGSVKESTGSPPGKGGTGGTTTITTGTTPSESTLLLRP